MPEIEDDDLEEDEVDTSLLFILRRILSAPLQQGEDWRRTSIFQTLVCCGDVTRKLIIDGSSCMNSIPEATVEKIKLSTELHPELHKTAWINGTTIPVTKIHMVSLTHGPYNDAIWRNVIPMTVTHILLGCPWLYDQEVMHDGKENTYSFYFNEKQIVSKPLSTITVQEHQALRPWKSELIVK
jgi:hypothetical protein